MDIPTLSDYLLKAGANTVQSNVFVRLTNNTTGTSYVSTAVTDSNGMFTVNTVPPGQYTVATGPSGTGPWTNTGDANYDVTSTIGLANITDYGAAPSATDNATFIQAGIDAANAIGGGTVYVPTTATPFITSSLTMKPNVRLYLESGAVLKLKNSTNDYLIKAPTGASSGTWNNVAIEGHGTFDCNGANQTAGGGMNLAPGDLTNGSIDGLILRDFTLKNSYLHGIRVTEGPGGSTGSKLIENVTVDGHGLGGIAYGIYCDYSPGTILIGCLVRNSHAYDAYIIGHGGRYKMLGCVAVDSDIQFPFADDSVIMECVVVASVGNGINNDNNTANRMRLIGNVVISCQPGASYGALRVTGTDAIIADNHVTVTALNTSTKGIMVIGDGARIHGNRVVGSTGAGSLGYGIAAEGSKNVDIHDNYLSGPFLQGVSIEHDDVTVHDNKIDGPATGILLQNTAAIGRTVHRVNVHDNTLLNNTTAAVDYQNQTDPSNRIHHNPGYNPVVITTPAVSTPLTNTYSEDIYVSFIANAAGTTFTVNTKALAATPANAQSGFIWPAGTVMSYVNAPASWAFLGLS